jgi:zinc-dependent metalloproteinase lipoprotein
MKKISMLLLGVFAVATSLISQSRIGKTPQFKKNVSNNLSVSSKKHRCYTAEAMKAFEASHPNAINTTQFENWLSQKNIQRKSTITNGTEGTITNYVLPIVFHIVHNGESVGTGTNLSQAVVYAQLAQINRDFQNLNGSIYGVASTTGIQFALATQNASGATLAEPGIDRINRNTRGWTAPPFDATGTYWDNTVKANSIWDPSRFVNVWIANLATGNANTEVLGIATFPASSTLTGLDNLETNSTAGVTIEVTTVGSSLLSPDCGATNQFDMGRTVTHELGHFFGLRHIWGDGTQCSNATDYVADTPTQLFDNSGKPIHPKPNTCGTLDEMFDNYMDYSDDQVMTTFTMGQVDRMQTVMANSPRRLSLATSTVPKVFPSNASNAIGFTNCTGQFVVREEGNAGTTNRYRDYSIPLAIMAGATGNATITITTALISGVPLAVNGVDYQILTPTVTVGTGDYAKNVIVRVIDNAQVDAIRGVQIGYTISGSGVTNHSTNQTLNFYITDNDNVYVGNNTTNALFEDFSAGTKPTGWGFYKSSAYTSEFVVGTAGNAGGTSPNAYVSSTPSAATPLNTYSTSSTGVYALLESPLIDGGRFSSLGNLNFKYGIKGRTYSNSTGTGHYGLLLFTNDSDPNYSLGTYGTTSGATGYGPWANTTTTQFNTVNTSSAAFKNYRFYVDFYFEVSTASSASNPGLNIDDVVLPATPFGIESAIKNSYTFDIQQNQNHSFRTNDATNKTIAAILPVSGNVSNVVASITESGNDRLNFLTGSTNYLRSRKVLKIVPSATDNTTQITVTYYLTQAEASIWGSAVPNLKLMKIIDGVSLSGNINTINATIGTTTYLDRMTADGYASYTATFTGFGQFVLVEQGAVLPLQWGSFTGNIVEQKTKINFTTFNEVNVKYFEVEKSINAIEFKSIATLKALNGSTNNYQTIDASIKPNNKYYYRLKQVDNDGKFSYSNTITVMYLADGSFVNVYPNPVKSMLTIQLNDVSNGETKISIATTEGKVIYQSKVNTGTSQINTSNWSKGVYVLKVIKNEKQTVTKVIKE